MSTIRRAVLLCSGASALIACGHAATLPVSAGYGPTPTLPEPRTSLIPLTKVATAIGWPAGQTPMPAPGLQVTAFASGLDHPRFVYALPNGDVLVAETNAPVRPDDGKGIKGFFFHYFQKKAGGAVPSADRITLLRDTNGDGVADVRSIFLGGLHSPFGMTLIGSTLYVANTDGLVRYPYAMGDTVVRAAPTLVVALPSGRINHHWTKTVVASPDTTTLYVSIGSNSNVGENGLEAESDRAVIWAVDRASGAHRTYASGLRNAAGLTIEPVTGRLWAAVNERDEIGGDLVPDYLTSVRDGGFYGWPWSYFGSHVDARVSPARPDLVATALSPDYALGAHTASIGLVASRGSAMPSAYCNGMFIGQHGSWNRSPRSGYAVIFIPFTAGQPRGTPLDVLGGFLTADGRAMGRPVGVTIDAAGGLLVADDVGNTIWRVRSDAATVARCPEAAPR